MTTILIVDDEEKMRQLIDLVLVKSGFQTVHAGALNQAIKAVAIARGFVAPSGTDLICAPAFADIIIAGEDRTALKLLVEKRTR